MSTNTIYGKTLCLATTETMLYRFLGWKNLEMTQAATELSKIVNPQKINKPL
jgi:hypothetical protein